MIIVFYTKMFPPQGQDLAKIRTKSLPPPLHRESALSGPAHTESNIHPQGKKWRKVDERMNGEKISDGILGYIQNPIMNPQCHQHKWGLYRERFHPQLGFSSSYSFRIMLYHLESLGDNDCEAWSCAITLPYLLLAARNSKKGYQHVVALDLKRLVRVQPRYSRHWMDSFVYVPWRAFFKAQLSTV